MPPSSIFNKKRILEVAYDLAADIGVDAVTARLLADKLESSTAPIYSYFKNMNELQEALIDHSKELLFNYLSKNYTNKVFLNYGTGMLLFAQDNKEIFKSLFFSDKHHDTVEEIFKKILIDMKKDDRFRSLNKKERYLLLEKIWTHTIGLCSMVCFGFLKDLSLKEIERKLIENATPIINSVLNKDN